MSRFWKNFMHEWSQKQPIFKLLYLRNADPILLKLVPFCSESSAVWAGKFSPKSEASGDILLFFVLFGKE